MIKKLFLIMMMLVGVMLAQSNNLQKVDIQSAAMTKQNVCTDGRQQKLCQKKIYYQRYRCIFSYPVDQKIEYER